jgi:hypothetical protein
MDRQIERLTALYEYLQQKGATADQVAEMEATLAEFKRNRVIDS